MRLLIFFIFALNVIWSSQGLANPSFLVVVNPKNPVSTVTSKFLADAFLKKVKFWENGQVILPADLPLNSPTRAAFSDVILGRPVLAVRNYWQQLIFSGRGIPPPEFKTDALLIRYVLSHPNAVGYVSREISLEGLKALTVQ